MSFKYFVIANSPHIDETTIVRAEDGLFWILNNDALGDWVFAAEYYTPPKTTGDES